jgi:hypothetical protein
MKAYTRFGSMRAEQEVRMSQVLERAQHGQADAIAILLNRFLKPQGISAQVFQQGDRLQVVLEAMDVPDPKRLLRWLVMTLDGIHPEGICWVQIQARRAGDQRVDQGGDNTSGAWVETFAVQAKRLVAIDSIAAGRRLPGVGPGLGLSGSGGSRPADLVALCHRGDLAAIQVFVDQMIGNPSLFAHVALTVPVLKITVQTIQFLDGPRFAGELLEKLRPIASEKIRVIEMYKRKTASAPLCLMARTCLDAKNAAG